ncbi:MAG: tetratricopeptide repeat protein, partial [Promethearchaeota archaeon]
RKFREGISFIRLKVKDYDEREAEVEKILDEIDKTHSEQISYIKEKVKQLTDEKKLVDAFRLIEEARGVSNKIKNIDLKNLEIEKIDYLMNETKIQELINQGVQLREMEKFDDALDTLQKAMNKANDVYSSTPQHSVIIDIRNIINETYLGKIKSMITQADGLKQSNKPDDAIKTFEEALKICDNLSDLGQKESEALIIKTRANQINSEKVAPLIQKGEELLNQNNINDGIAELKKAEKITIKMYDSDQKSSILKKLGGLINPIYTKQIISVKEKGIELLKEEGYEEKINIVTDAASTLKKALEIALEMIDSEEKTKIVNELSELIDNTCSAGISVRKKRGRHLIEEKKFEEAVGEMYSALSIAKNMACAEEDNSEIEDIKFIVNQIYSSEINHILEQGKKLLSEQKNEEALELFNEALGVSNKMYVSEEMDEEIRKINELLREAEIKKLVSEGSLILEQKKFTKELEDLQKALEDADKITDMERKRKKIREIKELIDQVHSKEIQFLKEQATLLASQDTFKEAYEELEKALKVAGTIDNEELKNQEINNIIKLYTEQLNTEAKQGLENRKFDEVIEICRHAIELDEHNSLSYYNLGNALLGKKEYDNAIENYQKAVNLDPDYVIAWNNMGLAHELKGDYDKALKFLKKAVDIDKDNSIAWYRMGNVYKHMNDSEKAIESYKLSTNLNPKNPNAWLFMGSIYHEIKDFNNAVEHIKKALNLDPSLEEDVGSIISNFEKTIDSMQNKLIELFKNKQD